MNQSLRKFRECELIYKVSSQYGPGNLYFHDPLIESYFLCDKVFLSHSIDKTIDNKKVMLIKFIEFVVERIGHFESHDEGVIL